MIYACCTEARRKATLDSALNGIDFLEVLDDEAPSPGDRQRVLHLHFLKPVNALGLTPANVRITGGERIRTINVASVSVSAPPADRVAVVRLDAYGDFSMYTLRIENAPDDPEPPPGLDPRLASIDFSFKVQCPTDLDCKVDASCIAPAEPPPEIDYLARDFPTFRRLMLDRMSATAPGWTERNAADLGVTLVELLAYAADQLSYQQDAVATEAYLDTARRRISVRRHARLMDYEIDDGSNARAWIGVRVRADQAGLPDATRFLGAQVGRGAMIADEPALYRHEPLVFELMESPEVLRVAHNEIPFYTWSEKQCCLPKGATEATLGRALGDLEVGDVLVFEEVRGPSTGHPADADIEHRHAVRLTYVSVGEDPVTGAPITHIRWHEQDALPFPLCVSSLADDGSEVANVSVALGNIVLADHGLRIEGEAIGNVPDARLRYVAAQRDRCDPEPGAPIPPRFNPAVAKAPLTQRAAHDRSASASSAIRRPTSANLPEITLIGRVGDLETSWTPRRDLLDADGSEPCFVVEIERDGRAFIRFGDDVNGRRPAPGTTFTASYRIGNGTAGNVGAGAIAHIVGGFADIESVRNPLAAQGGREPESVEHVRQAAPIAYRTQRRAVTAADYAAAAERYPGVQKAAATMRWTGSWHTAFITVDREAGRRVNPDFERDLRAHVEAYRMAGHDVNVDDPIFVALEIELFVCCKRDYLRSAVKRELLDVLSARDLPDGRRGLFHPDHFTFGQPVYLSPIYAAVQAAAGVESVDVRVFRRLGDVADTWSLRDGVLSISRLEIARLDNNPNFVERGVLRLEMGGGR